MNDKLQMTEEEIYKMAAESRTQRGMGSSYEDPPEVPIEATIGRGLVFETTTEYPVAPKELRFRFPYWRSDAWITQQCQVRNRF